MSDELVAFLKAHLDAEEQAARAAAKRLPAEWRYLGQKNLDDDEGDYYVLAGLPGGVFGQIWDERDEPVAAHIARWDPARVLAEVQAKRRIIEEYERSREVENSDYTAGWAEGVGLSVHLLALPYASCDGYRAEWAPSGEASR